MSEVVAILLRLKAEGFAIGTAGDQLKVKPVSKLTSELRAALTAHKGELLAVVSRLEGMHANDGKVPVPCAVLEATGGPGRCFSCGDGLEHPESYGRCTSCAIAAEVFHAGRQDGDEGRAA